MVSLQKLFQDNGGEFQYSIAKIDSLERRLRRIFNVCPVAVPEVTDSLPGSEKLLSQIRERSNSLRVLLKGILMYTRGAVATLAMVNYPFPWHCVAPMPANPVAEACKSATD